MDNFPFWIFSLDRYDRAGVAGICLKLQERHQLDVNILLFSVWLADLRVEVELPVLQRLIVTAERFHTEVVRPLRRIRQGLKHANYGLGTDQQETFRAVIKNHELRSENLEQRLLFDAYSSASGLLPAEKTSDVQTISVANLDRFFEHLKIRQSAADHQDIAQFSGLCAGQELCNI